MTDHKAALEHAQQFADSTQSGEHANLCRAYLELAQHEKAGWRYADELEHERKKLTAENAGLKIKLAAMLQQAQKEERERCASIANNMFHAAAQGDEIAEAIRKGE